MNTQNWQKTKDLFSKIITDPPLIEKYLKRPPPKYIFKLIINTMKKTGFPKGLFSPEEETMEYFMAEINHRKQIFKKIIDITKIVTKINLDIDIENILKGMEADKTNILLQNFYQAATTNINSKSIIDKYLNDIKNKIDPTIKDKISKIIQEKNLKKNKQVDGYIFWIDKNVYNEENKNYFNSFKNNVLYKQMYLKFFCFENLEEAFYLILNYIDFKMLFIIISGEFYPYYYYKLKENIKFLKCLPISIIFTSDDSKEIFIKRISVKYYLTEEIFDSINNSFYNFGGVSSDFNYCINFIFNFYINSQNKFKLDKTEESSYDGCITFEYIYSKNQLVLPFLYCELMNEKKVSDNDIQIFINYLLINHRDDEIIKLMFPLLYIKGIPHEIIVKYLLRAYTLNNSFYSEMNKLLMKHDGKIYQTFIKLIFEGLLNKSIYFSEDNYLYRGTQMTKNEIDNIMKSFEERRTLDHYEPLPLFLLYSRCFLSFSKDENKILEFIDKTEDKFYRTVFILKNNNKINNKYYYNVDVEFFSAFTDEKEVIFLPFSTFC